jgi:hypothetical protein|nr:MAG TPA: hypothetical protein [Caudoviricetes sp.]
MDIKCEGTCNNNGIDNTYSVTIPRDRYEELIDMETRADVLISVARREKYIDLDVVLIILGELPLEVDKK